MSLSTLLKSYLSLIEKQVRVFRRNTLLFLTFTAGYLLIVFSATKHLHITGGLLTIIRESPLSSALLAILASVVVLTTQTAFGYLQAPVKSSGGSYEEARLRRLLEREIQKSEELRAGIEHNAEPASKLETITQSTPGHIAAEIKAKIAGEIRAEFVKELTSEHFLSRIEHIFRTDETRLEGQVNTLRRRGNINLLIGVAITIAAAFLLVFTVALASPTPQPGVSEMARLLRYFLPRLSTVIFVEVFAFFFLKLYKATLDEEKYYQGQITTRTSRHTAILLLLQSSDSKSLPQLIESLCSSETLASSTSESSKLDPKDFSAILEGIGKLASTIGEKAK